MDLMRMPNLKLPPCTASRRPEYVQVAVVVGKPLLRHNCLHAQNGK